MTVPWSGFPMRAFLDLARPLAAARYVEMHTFSDPKIAPGQHQHGYPWPYVEGLTIEEAANELTFLATGIDHKPLPKQNGAPLRLAVPWNWVRFQVCQVDCVRALPMCARARSGIGSSLVSMAFGPTSIQTCPTPDAANRPQRVLGTNTRVPTLLFNGYAEFVRHLYDEIAGERLFT